MVFDQIGTPTYAGDLALGIFSVIEGQQFRGHEGLYHFSNEGVSSWYDFAVEIAAAAGARQMPHRAVPHGRISVQGPPPAYSVLDKSKFKTTFGIEIPHWRESMLYCLKTMQA